MESSEEEKQHHAFLDPGTRATRGKRMTKLLDGEIEEDELFWNQDALKEDEVDIEYEEETETANVFDSDFDEDEPDADEEVENEPGDRPRKIKKLSYPGIPPSSKKKTKVLSKLEVATEIVETQKQSNTANYHNVSEDVQEEKTVRKSTRTSVLIRQAERVAIRAAVQATLKPIKRKKEGREKRMTPEEMLLEAAQTEIMNLRNLERVLAIEKKSRKELLTYCGPLIRLLYRNGYSYLDFINGSSFESDNSTKSTQYPKKAVCAVSGVPVKYRDPKTGLPYGLCNKRSIGDYP